MDDVNNMDESIDTGEEASVGISRRDMIKASVIAGGLVWTAPVLLAGRASAAPSTCCPPGFETAIAIKYTTGNTLGNCGVTCLDMGKIGVNGNNLPCPDLACISQQGFAVTTFDTSGGNPITKGTIVLNADVRLIAAAVRSSSTCFWTECDDPAHPGLANDKTTGFPDQCEGITPCPTPSVANPNRIWVTTAGSGSGFTTTIHMELQASDFPGNSGINQAEIYVCVDSRVTGRCGG